MTVSNTLVVKWSSDALAERESEKDTIGEIPDGVFPFCGAGGGT